MRPYCPAIRHFLDCHGNISSFRRSLTFKARWSDRLERGFSNDGDLVPASPATPVLTFSFSFSFLFLFPFSPPLPFFPTKFE